MIALLFTLYLQMAVLNAKILVVGFVLGVGVAIAERVVESIWHK